MTGIGPDTGDRLRRCDNAMMALGVCQIQPLTESPHLPVDLRADHPMPVHQTLRIQVNHIGT